MGSPQEWPAHGAGRNTTTGETTHVAVKIRLKRFGKIRSPHYRIVVADSRTKRDGRAIEEIGKYHPKNDPSVIEVDSERAQYWLSVGAQPSEAVVALLKRTGDWQKFSGDMSPSGVLPQPEKPNKTDVFNAALADAGKEPKAAPAATAKLSRDPRPSITGPLQRNPLNGIAQVHICGRTRFGMPIKPVEPGPAHLAQCHHALNR